MKELVDLFPTPLMRVGNAVDAGLIEALVVGIERQQRSTNFRSEQLSHTAVVDPEGEDLFRQLQREVGPYIDEFGQHLFGEALEWTVKEMWINVLESGGRQAVHSHTNSFISAILYLTETHESALTVFHKALGGTEFLFSNFNRNAEQGPYNSPKWVLPEAAPGDLVLYPSYLLHEVPPNRGGRRMTVAMNAIPDRLDSWGYRISFGK